MKRLMKKTLVALLSVGMVITMIPFTALPVEAATNLEGGFEGQDSDVFSALGFDTSELPEGYDPDNTDNPYGRDKIPGNQVHEVSVAGSSGTKDYGVNNNDVQASDISGIPTGKELGLNMSASAAGDFDGDGLAGEIVYVGYSSELTPPTSTSDTEYVLTDLSLRIYNGQTGNYGGMKKIGAVHAAYSFPKNNDYPRRETSWLNLLQVTAGDYDGDGVSEIAVYVAENENPRIDVYKYQKTSASVPGDWIEMQNWDRVWSHAVSGTYLPNMVSLVSGDINRDGVDDLGISYGLTLNYDAYLISKKNDPSRAVILWGDRAQMLQQSSPLDLATDELGEQVRVSLIMGDLDGDGVKELIATGQPQSNFLKPWESYDGVPEPFYAGNTERTVVTYTYDLEQGLLVNSSDLLKPVEGNYEVNQASQAIAWTSGNGFDSRLNSLPVMRTNSAVFKPQGADYAYLYLDSCLYQSVEGTLALTGELDETYDGEHSLDLPYWQCWGARIYNTTQGEYAEYGASAADINGEGNEILIVNSTKTSFNMGNGFYEQYAVVNGTKEGLLEATITCPETNSTPEFQGQSLTFIDCDTDTVIMEYTGQHYLTYSDPKVLAIIAAAPYFEDVDEATGYEFAGNNTNSWGMTHGTGSAKTVSVEFGVGGHVEQEHGFASVKFGMEWEFGVKLSYEHSLATSYEYTMTFGTYGDQDAVAFYSVPIENYVYLIKTPDGKGGYTEDYKTLPQTYQPVYQVLTLDYYESIQGNYNTLPPIRGKAITSTPGDPASYPSSEKPYEDRKIVMWDKQPAGVGYGNGSITQEISISQEEEDTFNFGGEVSLKFCWGSSAQFDPTQHFWEVTGGFQLSLGVSGGWTKTSMQGTTISAEVANMPLEFQPYGYYFNWKLFSYYYEFGDVSKEEYLTFSPEDEDDPNYNEAEVNDSGKTDTAIGKATTARVPVITFIVNDVAKPPELPEDFQQDYDRTTSDTNVMTWTYDDAVSSFIIYKQFDFPVGGGLQEVDRIQPGDESHYRIKYNENGKPYKEYFYADTDLSPYTEYQYAIQVERTSPVPPLSTPSALVTARTKSEDGHPKITISESDEEQDGKLLVYPDKNAYLTVGVTGPEGETIGNYYSVVQYQWQKKDKGAWEDMIGETNKTLTFASAGVDTAGEYRCRVNVITKANNIAITAYSKTVELTHAKRVSYMKEVSVTDVTGGGIQLYAEVANAHKDSASIPGGTVTFNLTSNNSGELYQYAARLSAAGTATAILDQVLPEGMYTVEVYYSGSYIFKDCYGETLYLSQRDTGYIIDLPASVTYGDEAEIIFREVSKTDGVTSTENIDADTFALFRAAPLSRASLSGAVPYTAAPEEETPNSVTAGTKYYYTDNDGVKWYFTAPVDGVPEFDLPNGCVRFGTDLSAEYIQPATGYNSTGRYILKEGTPTGVYLIFMKAEDVEELDTAYGTIEVLSREVTLQIPKNLKTGESSEAAADILFKDLTLVNGSWADCDIDENDFIYAEESIVPLYYNTAGTEFGSDTVRAFCGAYSIIGTAELPNYSINWRSGQLTVLGAAKDVHIGARPFDGLDVGKVYMMSPEIGVATGPLNSTGELYRQIQAGVRMVFSAQPDDGYEVYDWFINGVAQNSKSTTLIHTMLAEDTDVEVQFAIKQNTLTFGTAGDENGGTLTCSDSTLTSGSVLRRNASFTFTAEAKKGYHFKEWRYTEQGLGTSYDDEDNGAMTSTFDFIMPGISCSLYAVFERDGYVFNLIDGNNAAGLVATYVNEEGKTVTAKSGSTIKGGTQITVAPAAGYVLDPARQYVSQGTQGTVNEEGSNKATYTLTLDQDTTVYGWTKQESYDLTLAFDYTPDPKSAVVPDATIRYIIDNREYSIPYDPVNTSRVIPDIPGGTPITVSIDYPGWVDFRGWTANGTKVTADTGAQSDWLAQNLEDGGKVVKNQTYKYIGDKVEGDGTTMYHFTATATGTVKLDKNEVTIYSADTTYTIPAMNEADELTVFLQEKAVRTVTMKDISEEGSQEGIYRYELPEGGFNGDSENIVNVHDGDDFTVMVKPSQGKTVSYWKTSWMDGETPKSVKSQATSLRYTIPSITMDYNFEPIFSTTTYNLVSWPTISKSQNNLTLNAESGYTSSVATGEDFKFKLTGASLDMVEKVYGNGIEFTGENGTTEDGTCYKIEGGGVYSITNITRNQEITVEFKDVGVTVNGVDIKALSGVGWKYDSEKQLLTLTRSGLMVSGNNIQANGDEQTSLAPGLRILMTDAVGSVILDSLAVTSDSADSLLTMDGSVLMTLLGKNTLSQTGSAALAVKAREDWTIRGNGTLDLDNTVYVAENMQIVGTAHLTIDRTLKESVSEGNYSLYVGDALKVGEEGTSAAPTLRVMNTMTGEIHADGCVAYVENDTNLYGGEAAVYNLLRTSGNDNIKAHVYGLSTNGNVNCYDGILSLTGYSGAITSTDDNSVSSVRAYYEKGYMCSIRGTNNYEDYSRLRNNYIPAGSEYDTVASTMDETAELTGIHLSPLSGNGEKAEFILSVKDENGNTYSRDLTQDTNGNGVYYYYIVPDDADSHRIEAIDKPDHPHDKIPEGAIIVAENHVASNSPQLFFSRKIFGSETKIGDTDTYTYVPEDISDEDRIPYDYTISGSYSGDISSIYSRGNIYADGRKYEGGESGDGSECIKSLTLKDLTHNKLYVGGYPIYLEGSNYLMNYDQYASSPSPVLITKDNRKLDLRGSGTLTISSGQWLEAEETELHDIGALSITSPAGAIMTNSLKFYHDEIIDGEIVATELPYGFGWLEDMGREAGAAKTLSELNTEPDSYAKFYSISSDPKSEPAMLLDDKSSMTSGSVRLTPPAEMGVPHVFDTSGNGCKVELIDQNEKTVLTSGEGGNYSYAPATNETIAAWNNWKGDLTFDYSTEPFRSLDTGTYTLRVYFTDENAGDEKDSAYTLDIPLIVIDADTPSGNLSVDKTSVTLTRGNEDGETITTSYEGTRPKSYSWEVTSNDPNGSAEGISLVPAGSSSRRTVMVGEDAATGTYTITVTSYSSEEPSEDSKLDSAPVTLNVVPKAIDIGITCPAETPSGDGSYMLNHNSLGGEMKEPWAFEAEVTMDEENAEPDPGSITWALLNGSYSRTKVVPNEEDPSKCSVYIDPNETDPLNTGQLILCATYENPDKTTVTRAIRIRLSEDAIVSYTPAAEGGTISSTQVTLQDGNPIPTPIPKNTEVTFTAAPSADYEVDTWYINGQPVEDGVEGNTMTFTTEKMGRYNIWATFAKVKNCKVTFEKTGSGTITAETENETLASGDKVAGGTTVTFTAMPDTYNQVTAWYVNGEKQEGEPTETLTISDIRSDVSVKVDFEVPDRTVTVTTVGNGTVTFLADGIAQPVDPDESGKYVITAPADQIITAFAVPGKDYSVERWSELSNATASDAICTVPRSMEDAAATITFKTQPTYEVSVSANSYEHGWGSIAVGTDTVAMSANQTFTVPEGGSLILKAVPDAGSTLYDWEISPGTYEDYVDNGNELTLMNVSENVTVAARFYRDSKKLTLVKESEGEDSLTADYNLTLPDGTELEKGSMTSEDDSKTLRSGTQVIVTVTPGSGQIPANFTVNGEDKSAELVKDPNAVKFTYTIEALTEDTEIKAVFDELEMYEVTGHEAYTEKVIDESGGEPVETEKHIGTVDITKFGVENGFNYEVEDVTPQQVMVVPNTPIEITFTPEAGYLVDIDKLSEEVIKVLGTQDEEGTEETSQAAFSFKQTADSTILLIEGIDQDLDFSQMESPFVEQKEEDVYVKLYLHQGDNGMLTVTNEAEHIQYTNGASILSGTEITYEAVPKEHYSATVKVKVNTVDSETTGTLTLTDDMEEISIDADFVQSEYPVTITTLGRGSGKVIINDEAYDPGEHWLSAGSELIIRAEAADGCAVDEFLVAGAEVTGESKEITLNEGIDIVAAFSDTMRTVTYNSPTNGKLKVLDAQGREVGNPASVPIGSKLYVVYTPDPHYTLKTLTVGEYELTGDYFTVDEERGNNVYCEFTRAEDKVTWIAVYGTVDAQLMPEGESIGNGQYVPAGSQIKFKVTPKNDNYSLESLTVNGEAMSADNYYEADQEDVEAIAICEYTGDVPGVSEGVRVTWLATNCTITAELANGTQLKNGDYVKPGDKIKFTHTPKSKDYTLDKFTVIGAERGNDGYYVAGSEDIVASAVYNAPATIIHDQDVPLVPDATYTVLIDSGEGGHVDVTINGDAVKSGAEVDLGSKLTIKAVPDEGKQLKTLTVNGVKFNNGEEYVVYANTLIKAEFEEATEETGLPCYKDDKGNTVYSGFSYDLNGDGVYTENEYIIPKDVEVHFQENHKYFEDMPGNWADEYIQFVGDREIFQGVTDTLFDPEGKVTRAMYVTVIGRLYERSFGAINGGTAQNFTDCDYDSWYGKYVDWAAATGVVNGYDAETFGPNDNVTREQMAAILTRFAKLMKLDTKASGSLSFTDTDTISDYAVDSVQYCVDKGIINGYDDGRFAPQDNATRAQIAAVIVRYIESVLSE